ncbi:hypothetical protein J1605_022782 [Eschrichtius robustus]|uniref:Uncharacterized protein n=1 Tax=Eschrichtius robustus TaxID=9764 RepID=A0AB34H4M9_ESCRO|nr:hypothetical protein J1605_022782 [Eschrichtius robustus]
MEAWETSEERASSEGGGLSLQAQGPNLLHAPHEKQQPDHSAGASVLLVTGENFCPSHRDPRPNDPPRPGLAASAPMTGPLRGQQSRRPQPKPRVEAANRTPLPASFGEAPPPRVGR